MKPVSFLAKLEQFVFLTFLVFLPTQFGKHFWPPFAIVQGLRVDYLAPIIYVSDVLLIGLFLLWLVRLVVSQENSLSKQLVLPKGGHTTIWIKKSLLAPFLFLLPILYLLLTILLSGNLGNGLYSLLKFLEYSFLVYYVATTIKTVQQLRSIILCFAIATVFESGLAIAQYLRQASLNGVFYFFGERTFTAGTPGIANAAINGQLILRPYATFSHPNVLAGYLLFSTTLILLLSDVRHKTYDVIKNGRLPSYILCLTSLFLGSIALLLTFSRIAIVVWVLIGISVFVKKIMRKQEMVSILLFAAFITGVGLVVMSFFHPLVARFLQTSLSEESFVQRELLIQETVGLLQTHLLFGVGLGNFLPTLAQQNQLISLTFGLQPVHNIFLYVAAETGVIGFILFCWLLFQSYWHNFVSGLVSNRQVHFCFGVLVLAVLCTGMFDHYWLTLQQGQLLFSLLIGLCWIQLGKDNQASR